jgi:hypothetical protein
VKTGFGKSGPIGWRYSWPIFAAELGGLLKDVPLPEFTQHASRIPRCGSRAAAHKTDHDP